MPKYIVSDIDLLNYRNKTVSFTRMINRDDGYDEITANPLPADMVIVSKAELELDIEEQAQHGLEVKALQDEIEILTKKLALATDQSNKLKLAMKSLGK